MKTKYIIGIDEVGRGPIAGPVAVCTFLAKNENLVKLAISPTYGKKLPKLKDSKKLSRKQREMWFDYLKKEKEKGGCDYVVSFVSPENIDKFGIVKCIQKALNKNLSDLTRNFNLDPNFCFIYLDGGLKAPKEYLYQESIIKGDETHSVISLASIVAKVSRDKIMYRYAKEFPEYGFDKHVGYGTKAHYEAIKKYGQLPIHRKSFIH